MITQKHLQELLSFKTPSPSVVTVYLETESERAFAGYQRQLRALTRREPSLAENEDVRRIERYLAEEFEPGIFRGVAIFSAKRFGLWRACPLLEPVRDKLVVDCKPALAPLLAQTDQHHRFGVLLAGPERARFLEVFLGEVREYDGMVLPAAGEEGHRYVKTITDSLDALSRNQAFQRVVIGVCPSLALPLVNHLHTQLQQNLILDAELEPDATAAAVLSRITACEDEARKVRESVLVHRLLDAASTTKLAALGLDRTLAALREGRLRLLLARDGFAKMGRACPSCGRLSLDEPKCLDCRHATEAVFNLVAEMIDRAIASGCEVFRLRHDSPLDNLGKIGAELCDDKGVAAPVKYEETARTVDHAAHRPAR